MNRRFITTHLLFHFPKWEVLLQNSTFLLSWLYQQSHVHLVHNFFLLHKKKKVFALKFLLVFIILLVLCQLTKRKRQQKQWLPVEAYNTYLRNHCLKIQHLLNPSPQPHGKILNPWNLILITPPSLRFSANYISKKTTTLYLPLPPPRPLFLLHPLFLLVYLSHLLHHHCLLLLRRFSLMQFTNLRLKGWTILRKSMKETRASFQVTIQIPIAAATRNKTGIVIASHQEHRIVYRCAQKALDSKALMTLRT